MSEQLAYQNFTELEAWKHSRKFKNEIFELVMTFPADEKYRLKDQLIRASRSIGSNIAEGHGRFTYKEQLHFCIQARGSLSECYNHLIDAFDCQYIDVEIFRYMETEYKKVEKLLNGYITFLRKSINNTEK